jgi:hypothetical protein
MWVSERAVSSKRTSERTGKGGGAKAPERSSRTSSGWGRAGAELTQQVGAGMPPRQSLPHLWYRDIICDPIMPIVTTAFFFSSPGP